VLRIRIRDPGSGGWIRDPGSGIGFFPDPGSGSRIRPLLLSSVPDPKLIISDPDPDPQIENQEFRIRILDPDPSMN